MKIALVHDYLNQVGGGERVLDALMSMFPEAPIYTLMHDERKTLGRYAGRVKGTSFLDFQFARDHHRLFIPFMPIAARKMNLGGEYDLIISDSAGFGKGITYDHGKTKHLCYVHTPLRYAWETETYFGHNLKSQVFNTIFKPAFSYVRNFDYWAGQQPDTLLANSQYIARKVKEYYDREAEVVYPPVDMSRFYFGSKERVAAKNGEYYLAVGRLLHYKRFDLIIKAFAGGSRKLTIVGTGPEFSSLKAMSARLKSPVDFLGYVKDDAQLRSLYGGAKGFIMANEEDFGLVTAEAQACGTPVLAYSAGGSIEIVEPRVTGMLFHDQTAESLTETMEEFERVRFDRKLISERARRFGLDVFEKGIRAAVKQLIGETL